MAESGSACKLSPLSVSASRRSGAFYGRKPRKNSDMPFTNGMNTDPKAAPIRGASKASKHGWRDSRAPGSGVDCCSSWRVDQNACTALTGPVLCKRPRRHRGSGRLDEPGIHLQRGQSVQGRRRAERPSISEPLKLRTSGGSFGLAIRSSSMVTAASVIRRTGCLIVVNR